MRVKARIPVRIEGIDKTLWTENVSEGGCLITDIPPEEVEKLKENDLITATFEFPSGKKLRLTGKVRHKSESKIGIEFEDHFKGLLIAGLSVKNTVKEISQFAEEVAGLQKERLKKISQKFSYVFSGIKTLFIIFFMVSIFYSAIQHKTLQYERQRAIRKIEEKRHTKVITLIHRQEVVNFLGIPIRQYIRIEDAEAVLRAIRKIPDNKPIDLILHTPGGILLPAYQIARALKEHKGTVTVFVPHYAMSGGTLIALAADKIVMDKNAVLGPVDPQLMMGEASVPAVSILKIPEYKDWKEISDDTIVLVDQADKAIEQVKEMVKVLLKGKDSRTVNKIIKRLVTGITTHDFPLFYEDVKKLGLPVSTDMPQCVYDLMNLFNPGSRAVLQH